MEKLSKKALTLNERVKNMRARVEFPFGVLKTKFQILSKPWQERLDQQEHAIFYAVGIHNFEILN